MEKKTENLKQAINKVLEFLQIDNPEIELKEEYQTIKVNIKLENDGFLIGEDGNNLKEFEHLLRLLARKQELEQRLFLDINNYRYSQEQGLKEIAKETAHKVLITKEPVKLTGLNAYKRRVVHTELAINPNIATESEGQEPDRYLIVKPYP